MAVVTGTKTGNKEKLTKEQLELVAKAKKPVDIANKFRLAFLFIAVTVLVFLFFGNKLWEGITWYETLVQRLYGFLLWDILLMLIATFVKLFFITRYNKIVKTIAF